MDSGGAVAAAAVDDDVAEAVERVSSLDQTLAYFDKIQLYFGCIRLWLDTIDYYWSWLFLRLHLQISSNHTSLDDGNG